MITIFDRILRLYLNSKSFFRIFWGFHYLLINFFSRNFTAYAYNPLKLWTENLLWSLSNSVCMSSCVSAFYEDCFRFLAFRLSRSASVLNLPTSSNLYRESIINIASEEYFGISTGFFYLICIVFFLEFLFLGPSSYLPSLSIIFIVYPGYISSEIIWLIFFKYYRFILNLNAIFSKESSICTL